MNDLKKGLVGVDEAIEDQSGCPFDWKARDAEIAKQNAGAVRKRYAKKATAEKMLEDFNTASVALLTALRSPAAGAATTAIAGLEEAAKRYVLWVKQP